MPTVPRYGAPQAAPSSAPGARFTAPNVEDTASDQLQQTGAALQRAGSAAANLAIDMQQQVNQVRVDDGLNKVRQQMLDLTYNPQSGYKTLKGDSALTRPDGLPLSDEYGKKLKTTIDELNTGLGNDQQRTVFAHQANSLMTQFQSGIQQHTLEEYKSYSLSTQDGTIKLGMDEAKLNWTDPDKIRTSLDSVKAAVVRTGTLQGWSGSETMARLKQTTSSVHMGVLDTAMQENNPEYALGYMNRFKDEMTADDLLKVRGVITKDVNQRLADTFGTTAVASARRQYMPTDFDRMVAITEQTESGGNPNAVGKNIPGQGTAKGSMQVMDATAKNPGFGIKPAADDTPEERARVGRELVPALVKNYAGDASKAWAAYNAGSGTVDKAIAAADKNGTTWQAEMANFQSPANFKETQAYVAKNMAALGSGAGVAKPTLQDVHDRVRADIATKFGATPPAGMVKLALATATQQFEDLTKAAKAAEDQHVTEAMQAMLQNGGRFSDLPYAVRSKIPADKVDTVINFGQKISKGDDITNPAVYQRLSDPKVLTGLSDNQFFQLRSELSDSDFKQLANQRAAAQGKGNKVDEINMSAMNTALRDTLASLQMDPTPKDGTPEAAQLGTVKLFLKDSMLAHQRATGKPMTDAEVESHIKGLFAKSATFRSTFMGISTGSTTQRLMTMKAGDIPDDTRAALVNDFKRAGVLAPSDNDLLGAYLKLKTMPTRAARPRDTAQSKSGTIKY